MKIKLRNGSAASVDAYTGPEGEILVRSGKGNIAIQDNNTAGGVSLVPIRFSSQTPNVTSPIDGTSGVITAPVVSSDPYVGDGTHIATYWEVSNDPSMVPTLVATGRDTTNLTSLDLTAFGFTLVTGNTYYIRVRYESNLAPLTNWSPVSTFTTLSNVLATESDIVFASDAIGGDRFGQSVALSGDGQVMAVGAYLQTDAGTDGGKVYIYKWDSATLKWVEDDLFTGSDTQAGDFFGYSVSLNYAGDMLAVGAYMHDGGNAAAEGAVYTFSDGGGGGNWGEDSKVLASGNQDDHLGITVSLDDQGVNLVAGSDLNQANGTSSGAVFTWEDTGNGFEDGNENEVLANATTSGDRFGTSVSVSKDGAFMFVGAHLSDDAGFTDAGAVFVFSNDGNGGWVEEDTLYSPNPEIYGYFGYSVSTSTDGYTVVVGAYGEDINGSNAGGAYVFTFDVNAGTWDTGVRLATTTMASSDAFGRSVAIDGSGLLVMVGAYGVSAYAGGVALFSKASGTWVQANGFITASNGTSYDYMGISTSLNFDGSVGATGAFGEGTNGNEAGAVYTYL